MNKRQRILLFAGSLSAIIAGILLMKFIGQRNMLSREQIRDRMKVLQGSSAMPVIPNKSDITAEVVSVEKGEFPQVALTLQILESRDISGFSNLLKQGELIKAGPQYIYEYKAGTRQIILNDPQNIQNFQAYYVLPQDRLKAIARAKGGPQVPESTGGAGGAGSSGISEGPGGLEDTIWSITDIDRLAGQDADIGLELSPAPVPIVPNRSKIICSVLKVDKKDYPQVDVALRVLESRDISGFSNFLGQGVVITANPYYLYERGRFTPSEQQNSKNLLAYYLIVGDTVEAEATLRASDSKTGRDKLIWIISDLERVTQEER
jgi:hypothetical protein